MVPGRLLVFSGECVPLFILRPTGVAQLPQQRRALGFEVRHAMGATEFVAADAEMKNVWFEAISATCDGWAAGEKRNAKKGKECDEKERVRR